MRRKITKPLDEASDLPDLTEHQRKFVEALLLGDTASDAYRKAYECSSWTNKAIWVEAARLKQHPGVALWLSAARKAHLDSAEWSLQRYIRTLNEIAVDCHESGNQGARVQAVKLIGDAMGHNRDRLEVTMHSPQQVLQELASVSPALARQFAEQNGLPWQGETEH